MNYKKLSEFTNKEAKNLIVTLSAELQVLTKDEELMSVFKNANEQRDSKGSSVYTPGEPSEKKEGRKAIIELIPVLVNSLLAKNENAFWRILSAITMKTPDEVQEMNNLETLEILQDFFSIAQYKALFTRAIKSVIKK